MKKETKILLGIGLLAVIAYIWKQKKNNPDITIAPEDAQRDKPIVIPKMQLPNIKPFTIPTLKTPTTNNSIFSLKNLGKKELHFKK
jgi:hypothetical protein